MDSFGEIIQRVALFMPPFMIAVVFHEYAHGFMAARWGDNTAEAAGRLTLNPVAHADPFGTVLFPLISVATGSSMLFGWARPVPINPGRFRKYRPGLFMVSIAGIAMNCLLAILSAFILCGIAVWVPQTFYLHEPLLKMAEASIMLNYSLAIFNLIPLPPLDGSKIVESFLSYQSTQKFEQLSQYSFFILLALMMTGALSVLSVPITILYRLTVGLAATVFGIS